MIKQAYFRGLTKVAFYDPLAQSISRFGFLWGRPYRESQIPQPRRNADVPDRYYRPQWEAQQEAYRRRVEYERQRKLRQQTAESPVITYGNVTLRPTAAQNQAIQRAVNAYNAAKGVLNGERPATIPLPGGASVDVQLGPKAVQAVDAYKDKAVQAVDAYKDKAVQALKGLGQRFGF